MRVWSKIREEVQVSDVGAFWLILLRNSLNVFQVFSLPL
jgi:hypothetical protein